eukprot:7443777-Alexandrium_andersonii.AAC.1
MLRGSRRGGDGVGRSGQAQRCLSGAECHSCLRLRTSTIRASSRPRLGPGSSEAWSRKGVVCGSRIAG